MSHTSIHGDPHGDIFGRRDGEMEIFPHRESPVVISICTILNYDTHIYVVYVLKDLDFQ
jgi:hypothetical protein